MRDAFSQYKSVSGSKSLALFFHGGLVDKKSGMANAQQLLGPYSAANAASGFAGNAYPYFFVWESGLIETLQHNLLGIASEAIFQRLRDIIGGKSQSVIGGTSPQSPALLRTPTLNVTTRAVPPNLTLSSADIEEVQCAVENDPIINVERQKIARSSISVRDAFAQPRDGLTREVRTSAVTLLSPEIVSAIVAEEEHRAAVVPTNKSLLWNPVSLGTLALGAGKVLIRIISRYASGHNHNFHNTVVEEIFRQYYIANIGWAVWNEMKVETAEAFQGTTESNVGTALIANLIDLYESNPACLNARITLLGHSTGAIYICNFLRAIDAALVGKTYKDQIGFDVIFMAPAVRVDVLSQTIASYGNRIRNFRAFEMSDPLESSEILVQLDGAMGSAVNPLLAEIYTSSLLYFISGVLEDDDDDTPIDGMQRFFLGTRPFTPGSVKAVDEIKTFLARFPNPVIYSDTAGMTPQPPPGHTCTSHHHGGFPSDKGTLESVCYLLRTGSY